MARTPEGRVKDKVTKILKQYNAYYFFPATGGYGKSGIPDVVACIGGIFLGVECKADVRKSGPTPLQLRQLREISDSGGIAVVVDKNNVDDFGELVQSLHQFAVSSGSTVSREFH